MAFGTLEERDTGRFRGGNRRATEDPVEQWKHMRCLLYRVYDGLTVAEVARRMGVTERTVERWTQYALGYHGFPELKAIRRMIAASGREVQREAPRRPP